MKMLTTGVAKRLIFSLLLAGTLGGCAYYGPPAAYDPYPYSYGTPVYVGPPVSLDLGLGFYNDGRSFHRGHHHGHRAHHHHRGHHGGVHHGHRGGGHHGDRGFRHGGHHWR